MMVTDERATGQRHTKVRYAPESQRYCTKCPLLALLYQHNIGPNDNVDNEHIEIFFENQRGVFVYWDDELKSEN